MVGKDLGFLMTADRARAFYEASRKMFAALRETGSSPFSGKTIEMPGVRKDGTAVPTELSMSALRIKNRWYGMAFVRDITDRKKSEEALRESEKFKSIFESAADGLIYLDTFGRVLDANRKALEFFGGSKEELLGKHFTKVGLFSLKDMPTLTRNFAGILRGKKAVINVTIKNKNGRVVSLECSASVMKVNDKSTIAVVARGITELRRAEEKIRLLSNVVQQASEGIAVSDLNGRILFAKRALACPEIGVKWS